MTICTEVIIIFVVIIFLYFILATLKEQLILVLTLCSLHIATLTKSKHGAPQQDVWSVKHIYIF